MLCFFYVFTKSSYIYFPIFRDVNDITKTLCRGWHCGVKSEDLVISEELQTILHSYRNNSLNSSLYDAIHSYENLNFKPIKCILGELSLFGFGGYPQNSTKAFEYFYSGIQDESWLCYEHLAFPPNSLSSYVPSEKHEQE